MIPHPVAPNSVPTMKISHVSESNSPYYLNKAAASEPKILMCGEMDA